MQRCPRTLRARETHRPSDRLDAVPQAEQPRAPGRVRATAPVVTNLGTVPHDFKICASPKGSTKANTCTGKGTKLLAPKGKATLTYTFKTKGTYEYLCTVPSHAALGMKGVLKVT